MAKHPGGKYLGAKCVRAIMNSSKLTWNLLRAHFEGAFEGDFMRLLLSQVVITDSRNLDESF